MSSVASVNPMFDGYDVEGGPITGAPDKSVIPYEPVSMKSSGPQAPRKFRFIAIFGVLLVAIAVTLAVVLLDAGESTDASGSGSATDAPDSGSATDAPVFPESTAPPTLTAGTTAPTTAPTTTAPTTRPTSAGQPVCQFMFPVLRDTDSFGSGTGYLVNDLGDVTVTEIVERSFTNGTTLDLPMETTNGNPFNLPFANVVFSADPDRASLVGASVTLSAQGSEDLYIAEVGGLVTNLNGVAARFVEPNNPFPYTQRAFGNENTTALGINMGALYTASPDYCDKNVVSIRCDQPTYNLYYYAKVCTKGNRTPNPTSAPSPRALVPSAKPTSAPISSSPFISVIFTEDTEPIVKEAFQNATEKWNNIIANTFLPIPLPEGVTSAGSLGCGDFDFNEGQTTIEGLVIFASIVPIDGPLQILGSAGPCAFGSGDGNMAPGAYQPRLGSMRFDIADMEYLQNRSQLGAVIEHEMGHVIGIGTTWRTLNLAPGPFNGTQGDDPRYFGENGIEGYKLIGGEQDTIPVANTGGGGTAGGHWREKTFDDELMTGYLSANRTELGRPLSIMTVYSLRDLGYTVKPQNADFYTIPSADAAQEKSSSSDDLQMINDLLILDNVGFLSNDGAPAKIIKNPFA